MEKVGVIIAAAGAGKRMGQDKIFAGLLGRPLLVWAVEPFQSCDLVNQIVIVLRAKDLERGRRLLREYNWAKVKAVCPGGERRQDSVAEGLKRLEDCEWVVVHDGARPCLTPELIEKGLAEAKETGAAIAAVPVKDTIKEVEGGFVKLTPGRETLWAAQTPQVFRFELLAQAHEKISDEVSDDALMVEKLGHRVRVYPGSYTNVKVTTPEDLELAEIILRGRISASRDRI